MVFKKKFKKKAGKKVSTAIKAYVKKELNESIVLKMHPQFFATTPISLTTGTRNIISLVTPNGPGDRTSGGGAGYFTRQGDEVLIHGVEYTAMFNCLATGAYRLRTIIMVDKQPDGSAFVASELLYDVGSGLSVVSPRRYDMRHKWRILMDETKPVVSQYVQPAPGGNNVIVKYRHKFKTPIRTVYYATTPSTGAITDISLNCLYAVHFSDNANLIQISGYSNLLFSDA